MSSLLLLWFISTLLLSNPFPSSSQQTQNFSSSDPPWRANQTKTLNSPNSVFAAGFRSTPNDPNRFIFSIWYSKVIDRTIVWSANQDSPVNGSGSLVIDSSGQLVLRGSSGKNLWPSTAKSISNCTDLSISDDGNLVCGSWKSFDQPTDTILPTQNMSEPVILELTSNNKKFSFMNGTDLKFKRSESYWDTDNTFQSLDNKGKVTQDGGSIFSADFGDNNLRRLTLGDDGNLRIYSYNSSGADNVWTIVWQAIEEMCTIHGSCGPNAICMSNGTTDDVACVCPPGFKHSTNDQDTCDRKIPFKNFQNTKFLRLDYVNFSGDSNNTKQIQVQNYTTCEASCLSNDKCLGFGFKYDGSGFCVLQLEELLYGYWSPGTETAMFLRVDKSETDQTNFTGMTDLMETTCPVRIRLPFPPDESNTDTRNIVIICTLFAAELISGVFFFWGFLKKYIKYRDMARTLGLEFLPAGGPKRFSYAELKAATNDFSNLIGRGGFGDVYKGELTDHRSVAVKCLKDVAGGDTEFWAEVTIIARMHHLNLVRLWGFCAEKAQRILVYEYVPNGSLDKYLFRPGQAGEAVGSVDQEVDTGMIPNNNPKPMLDWGIRYRIALGVARSIAYLHEECLEWVLHCDIKPENILLGDDFCPKISDFGLAKLKKKEDIVSMSRIRGTRGYMAPEWVKMDPITPKADVYSFGMVLLEIVSGVRNFEIQNSMMDSEDWYFPRWAFEKAFKEMKVEDILDRQIKHCYDSRLHFDMVDRMVKTAMWCLQDRPEIRPSMGKVAKMLEGTVEITEPKKPTIFYLADE